MCNCTSKFAAIAAPRNDNVKKEQDWADRIVAARKRRPFTSLEEFARDTGLLRLGREPFEKHVLSQPGVRAALMRLGTERLLQVSKLLSGRAALAGDLRV